MIWGSQLIQIIWIFLHRQKEFMASRNESILQMLFKSFLIKWLLLSKATYKMEEKSNKIYEYRSCV